MKDYADFDLLVVRNGAAYQARVLHAPAGNGTTDFEPPFSREDLERLIPLFSGFSRDVEVQLGTYEESLFREAGTKLFRSVFSGQVLNRLQLSLAKAASQNIGIRIRLRLSDPEMALWPWEYLCDPEGHKWLALLPNLAIVRYPEVGAPVATFSVTSPLRILVVIASPSGRRSLDAEREWRSIEDSLEDVRRSNAVVLERLEHGTLQCLQERLERSHYHVLHFIGHGSHGPDGGVLIFEGRDGAAHPVSGRVLGSTLLSHSTLRLVVLNSCDGARDGEDDFSSVAETLVRNDIPSVVAMRAPVSNRAAVSFARHFYPELARGRPLEAAMTHARQRMTGDEHQVEWGTPVLYLRAASGNIIRRHRWPIYGGIATLLLLLVLGLSMLPVFHPRRRIPQETDQTRSVVLANMRTDSRCPMPPSLHIPFKLIEPPPDENGVTALEPFCIGAFEVTQEQWKKVMGGGHKSAHPGPDRPVDKISIGQARQLIDRLNQLDPQAGYRLPFDLEWDYAAGPQASDLKVLATQGNCNLNDDYPRTAPVGEFQPNQFGLYDMAGNVSEWVEDGAHPGEAVRRGGDWSSPSKECGAAGRWEVDINFDRNDTGFRIVRDPLPETPK